MKIIINNDIKDKNDKSEYPQYEVYAIVKLIKKEYCLIYNERLQYVELEEVTIVDDSIPPNWVYKHYAKPRKIVYHDLWSDNYTKVNYYLGPKFLIEDETFLIDIIEGDSEKTERRFFNSYIK